MSPRDDTHAWSDDTEPSEDGDVADGVWDTEAEAACPHCGATLSLALDPAGGRAQDYVEDCEVCCRASRVRLWYDATGAAEVQLQPVE